jgi:hypothetical protein
MPHWDIINLAILERALSKITWKKQHVKGHQDIFPLARDAALNEEMDQRCKKFWEEGPQTHLWYHQIWTVSINDHPVVSELTNSIRTLCAKLRATKYWKMKLGDHQNEINWTALGYASNTVPRSRSQWLTKHTSGFCSVGVFAKK